MTDPTYSGIPRPYDDTLDRKDDLSYVLGDAVTPGSEGGAVEEVSVKTGGSLADLWITKKIASSNWKPKKVGFMLDGRTGYAEFTDVYVSGAITAISGTIGGWSIGTAELSSGNVKIQSTAERILMGSATAPLTGTGIFIGKDGADYELRAGNPSTSYMHWDGTSLNIVGGVLTVATGTIGAITLDSTGHIKAGQTGFDNGTGFFLGYSAATPKFSIGNSTGNKMTWDGSTLITVGTIRGTSGYLGNATNGVSIDSTGLTIIGTGYFQTASSGARIILSSNFMGIYDVSGEVANLFASGSFCSLAASTPTGNVILNGGLSAIAGLYINGSPYFYASGTNTANISLKPILPSSNNALDLGSFSSLMWRDIFAGRDMYAGRDLFATRHLFANTVGYIFSGGTSLFLPTGWSSANTSTGRYTITHNLGTQGYSVIITPTDVAAIKIFSIETQGLNSFIVRIANTALTLENNPFMFTLIRYWA